MGHTTDTTSDHLVRSSVWSSELKEVLRDTLVESTKYVNWLGDWNDVGGTYNIPSIGDFTTQTIVENQAPVYESLDTGNFQFTPSEYIGSATYITEKAKQDMYYMNQLVSSFVPKQQRAIEEKVESDILSIGGNGTDQDLGGHTKSDDNDINGIAHRWVGGGSNETLSPEDFAKAKYTLKKAYVPMTNLIAIVDPSVAYSLETATNIVNVSNNPQWEGIITSGLTTGMRFIRNIYGFDVYESNFLPDCNETIGGVSTTAGKSNIFFSADQTVKPFIGKWVQTPTVYSEFNKDLQREEYLTVARYGVNLYRRENMVCILTDTDQVV